MSKYNKIKTLLLRAEDNKTVFPNAKHMTFKEALSILQNNYSDWSDRLHDLIPIVPRIDNKKEELAFLNHCLTLERGKD